MTQSTMEEPRRRGRPTIYPWDDVEVGQSITVPYRNGKGAHGSAIQWGLRRRNDARFSSKVSGDTVTITRLA